VAGGEEAGRTPGVEVCAAGVESGVKTAGVKWFSRAADSPSGSLFSFLLF